MDHVLKTLRNTEQELLKVLKQSQNPERIEQTLGYIRQLIETLEKVRQRKDDAPVKCGSVKKVEVFGGSPVLAQSAESAVQKWKWQPTSEETKEPVEVNFRPE